MNIVLGSNYESIVSETKKLANKTSVLKSKLSQIREGLDDSYDGQIDYDTEIKALEKRLNTQQTRMSNLSKAMDGAFDELVRVDAQKIEIDNNLKVALEKEQINSTGNFGVSSSSMLSIISKYKSDLWEKIIPVSGIVIPGVSQILQKFKEIIGNIIKDNFIGNSGNNGSSGSIADTVKDTADQIGEVAKDTIDLEKEAANYQFWESQLGTFVDTSNYPDSTENEGCGRIFNKTSSRKENGVKKYYPGNCTWYAYFRYSEVNNGGVPLKFSSSGSANGGEWHNVIKKDLFNVQEISVENIVANSLVEKPNHVLYVEGVATDADGQTYVYYSEGGAGVYKNGRQGLIQKKKIEDFAKEHQYIITAK